jgi:acyl-coenzyme A synthetase/AMP-(fatty) acid ligase
MCPGAPLSHRVARWLFRVIGRLVVNGYGTTETGGLASNGTITTTDGVEVRLADVPLLVYLTSGIFF